MAFSIQLLPKLVGGSELGKAGQYGEIELGDFRESFIAIIGYWSPDDYRRQWHQAITRLTAQRENACLITSLHDPYASDVLFWWLLYPEGETVTVQNAILLHRQ